MAKKKEIETAMFENEMMEEATPIKKVAKVKGGCLNIRGGKSLTANIVGALDDGAEIELLEEGADWCAIEGGYIKTEFIDIL